MINYQDTLLRGFANDIEEAFSGRIVSLVTYGSVVNKRSGAHSDVDFFLMLDKKLKDINDVKILNQIIRRNNSVTIDLSLQYLGEQSGYACDFQDGTKGPLALSYLASATLLLGNNIFVDLLASLSIDEYRKSIKKTVGYYLDTMRREAIVHGFDNEVFTERVRKYAYRTLIDGFLFEKKGDMAAFKGLKVDEVVVLARNNAFTKELIGVNYSNSPDEALDLIEAVYNKMVKYTS